MTWPEIFKMIGLSVVLETIASAPFYGASTPCWLGAHRQSSRNVREFLEACANEQNPWAALRNQHQNRPYPNRRLWFRPRGLIDRRLDDRTSRWSGDLPSAITRDFPHDGYRHSNMTVLVPHSSGSIVESRIEDAHAIHRTEPYWISIVALLVAFAFPSGQSDPESGPGVCARLLTLMTYPPGFGSFRPHQLHTNNVAFCAIAQQPALDRRLRWIVEC
jgi:hypothetical protein